MTSPAQNRDEIDLIVLFQKLFDKIKAFFLGLFKLLITLIVFSLKNIHYLILAAIIGGFVGQFFYKASKRYYSSDLVARSNGITNADMIGYLNDLGKLCKENNYLSLAQLFEIGDSTAQKIKNIEAFWFVDVNKDKIGDYVDFSKSFDVSDTTKRLIQDRFHLKVELYDNNAFIPFREGLYSYIKRNPYLQKLNQLRQEELKELISLTENEIKKLDSLQNLEYYESYQTPLTRSEGRITFMEEKAKQLYYIDKLLLLEKKQGYEKEFELSYEPITVIKDFTPLAKEENPWINYQKKYIPIFTLIGLIALLLIKNRKKIMSIKY